MARNVKSPPPAPPPSMPPLPPTAQHVQQSEPAPGVIPQAAPVPLVDVGGVQMEAHPPGTAQYIAELEAENAQMLADKDTVKHNTVQRFKDVATQAITHAVQMAGHLPQDISVIPGIDQINAEAQLPRA